MENSRIKKIAIVGGGIAGITAAQLLQDRYEVSLFEANDYLGGHTHTVDVETDEGIFPVDTGFIVFNGATYPCFIKLLQKWGVDWHSSNMSFSFTSERMNLCYSGDTLNGLFAQRLNLLKPQFYGLIRDIRRFNQLAKSFLNESLSSLHIGALIERFNLGMTFTEAYFKPMASAIWSMPRENVSQIPAHFLLDFYHNHGLLDLPASVEWYVVKGGSKQYVAAFKQQFSGEIYLNSSVRQIARDEDGIRLSMSDGEAVFDAVVLATHSDQALKLLEKPSAAEVDVLSGIPYTENEVILHTDIKVMPKYRRAWASWNYRDIPGKNATLTYYMNKLQGIDSKTQFLVSVNPDHIDEDKIIRRLNYSHPSYGPESVTAKQQHALINGQNQTFYTGAYWGSGFHEDGVVASLNALSDLGVFIE